MQKQSGVPTNGLQRNQSQGTIKNISCGQTSTNITPRGISKLDLDKVLQTKLEEKSVQHFLNKQETFNELGHKQSVQQFDQINQQREEESIKDDPYILTQTQRSDNSQQIQDYHENMFIQSKSSLAFEIQSLNSQRNYQPDQTNNSGLQMYLDASISPRFNQQKEINEFQSQTSKPVLMGGSFVEQQNFVPCVTQEKEDFKKFDQFIQTLTLEKLDEEVQCDVEYQEQSDFIEKHKFQLQTFEEMLALLKHQLALQQESESDLRSQITKMIDEIEDLSREKHQSINREQGLLMQTEQLVKVIEEQTQELKERDIQLRKMQEFEHNYYELQRLQNEQQQYLVPQIELEKMQDRYEGEKENMFRQIDELQEKLATEFNKKRQIKKEHEDKVVELNEEIVYYKGKNVELKDLLAKCTDQLKEFESLNLMRNDVIEKLEKENAFLKSQLRQNNIGPLPLTKQIQINQFINEDSYSPMKQVQPVRKSSQTESEYVKVCDETKDQNPLQSSFYVTTQTTPAKEDKSFSLHLQQVNCERSRQMSRDISGMSERPQDLKDSLLSQEASLHQQKFDKEQLLPQIYVLNSLDQSNNESRIVDQISENSQLIDIRQSQGGTLYMSERKQGHMQRRNEVNHEIVDTQKLVNGQINYRNVVYSQKQTPKTQNNGQIQFDLPKQSSYQVIHQNQDEFKEAQEKAHNINNSMIHLNNFEERGKNEKINNHIEAQNDLNTPQQSISQYDKQYQRRRNENQFLSPNQRQINTNGYECDPYKMSFGDLRQPLINDPYSHSEVKISAQRYKQAFNKENGQIKEEFYSRPHQLDMSPAAQSTRTNLHKYDGNYQNRNIPQFQNTTHQQEFSSQPMQTGYPLKPVLNLNHQKNMPSQPQTFQKHLQQHFNEGRGFLSPQQSSGSTYSLLSSARQNYQSSDNESSSGLSHRSNTNTIQYNETGKFSRNAQLQQQNSVTSNRSQNTHNERSAFKVLSDEMNRPSMEPVQKQKEICSKVLSPNASHGYENSDQSLLTSPSEYNYSSKSKSRKPFEYVVANSNKIQDKDSQQIQMKQQQNYHSQQSNSGESNINVKSQININNYQTSCTFAQINNESMIQQQQFVSQDLNDSMQLLNMSSSHKQQYGYSQNQKPQYPNHITTPQNPLNDESFSTQQTKNSGGAQISQTNQSRSSGASGKSSIRDEIKKLHNNINTLRQKMNIPNKQALKNFSHQLQQTPSQRSGSNTSIRGQTETGRDYSPTISTKSYRI
eukprot:403330974